MRKRIFGMFAAAVLLSVSAGSSVAAATQDTEAACEADAALVARAEGFYERRKAAKPLNDWARWLLSVGADTGAAVAPFSAVEMDGRVAVWAGWKPFAAELADYRDCVAAARQDDAQQDDTQQDDTQQDDTQQDDAQDDTQQAQQQQAEQQQVEPFRITLEVTGYETFRYAWRYGRSYNVGDIVLDGGYYWQASAAHTSTHFGPPDSRRPIYVNAQAWVKGNKKPNEWIEGPAPPQIWDAITYTYRHNGAGHRDVFLYSATDTDGTGWKLAVRVSNLSPNRDRPRGASCEPNADLWMQVRQKRTKTYAPAEPGDSPWVQLCSGYAD